jgi:hypothetical protein
MFHGPCGQREYFLMKGGSEVSLWASGPILVFAPCRLSQAGLVGKRQKKNISRREHPHRGLSTSLRFGRDDKGKSRYDRERRLRKGASLEMTGGESGIRTHGTLRYTRFPSVRLKPLGHLSR